MKEVFVVVAAEDEENDTAIAVFDNEEAAHHKANFVYGGKVVTLPIQSTDDTLEIVSIKATYCNKRVVSYINAFHYSYDNEELKQYENKVTLYHCSACVWFSKNLEVSIIIRVDNHLLVDNWRNRLEKYICNIVDQSQNMPMSYDQNAVKEFITNKIKKDFSDNHCVDTSQLL